MAQASHNLSHLLTHRVEYKAVLVYRSGGLCPTHGYSEMCVCVFWAALKSHKEWKEAKLSWKWPLFTTGKKKKEEEERDGDLLRKMER